MKIYQALGIEPIINAAGTQTTLGGSIMPPEVTDAMAAASRHFVDIHALHQAAGRRIAELVSVEAAHVCACASAGITLMAAACMTGTDQAKITRLPDTSGMKNRLVVHRAHRNPFDHAVHVAGGEFVEISADIDELKAAVGQQVAAVYYTLAWSCTGPALPLKQVIPIAHGAGVPVIVDAAAQVPPVENLSRFVKEGADLVVFSGGKAIRGPQSSGVILGSRELIQASALNDSPNVSCIGRGMKAAKEEIVGLVKAIELYVRQDHDAQKMVWERQATHLMDSLSAMDGVRAKQELPQGVGELIPHIALSWSEVALGVTLREIARKLREGTPSIAVRLVDPQVAGVEEGQIWLHVQTMREGEEAIVARRVREVLLDYTRER